MQSEQERVAFETFILSPTPMRAAADEIEWRKAGPYARWATAWQDVSREWDAWLARAALASSQEHTEPTGPDASGDLGQVRDHHQPGTQSGVGSPSPEQERPDLLQEIQGFLWLAEQFAWELGEFIKALSTAPAPSPSLCPECFGDLKGGVCHVCELRDAEEEWDTPPPAPSSKEEPERCQDDPAGRDGEEGGE